MREQLNTSSLKGKRKRSDRDASTPGLEGDEFLDELEGDEGEHHLSYLAILYSLAWALICSCR